ncbi:hypothetical protein BU17DRAFT_64656 [Hysterangium stoloniferum]|nr:hypothetical protein BU17DRAFT_64656 [Hysterangium stoloniferum]
MHITTLDAVPKWTHSKSPAESLPCEVLGEIFTQAMPRLLWELVDTILPTQIGTINIDRITCSSTHPSIVQTNLRSVCRHWDRVMKTTPRVWTTLLFERKLPKELERTFQRSGACHLDIFIDASLCLPGILPETSLFAILLRRNFFRIRGLLVYNWSLENGLSGSQWNFPILFPNEEIVIHAPALTYFSLLDCDLNELSGGTCPKLHAPKLKNHSIIYSFMGFDYAPETSASLRSMKLSLDGLICVPFPFLSQCHSLEILELVPTDGSDVDLELGRHQEPQYPTIKDIKLLSLKELHFFANSSSAEDFLSRIEVPSLHTLRISGGEVGVDGNCFEELVPVISSLLDQNLPLLSSVTFKELVGFELQGLQKIFSSLPRLAVLVLEKCHDLEPLFTTLKLPAMDKPLMVLCPQLRRLILRGNQFMSSEYLEFFNTRSREDLAEKNGVQCLSSVEIRDQRGEITIIKAMDSDQLFD